ncbi:MAG: Zn-ribbon domain-containing OB-fold protein [Marmoricola sp.]
MGRSLTGSRCQHCGTVAFPPARGCQNCGQSSTDALELGTSGTVWGFTVQRFAPKSPPYVAPPTGFVPFAVGYVELPEGVKVEAILDCTDFAELEGEASVTLVAADPVPRFSTGPALALAERMGS